MECECECECDLVSRFLGSGLLRSSLPHFLENFPRWRLHFIFVLFPFIVLSVYASWIEAAPTLAPVYHRTLFPLHVSLRCSLAHKMILLVCMYIYFLEAVVARNSAERSPVVFSSQSHASFHRVEDPAIPYPQRVHPNSNQILD